MKLDELEARAGEAAPEAAAGDPNHPAAAVPQHQLTEEISFYPDEIFKFICGTAGTGKTFAMQALAQRDPSVVLTATTGIAAVNLGGTTINSMLRYFDTNALVELSMTTQLDQRFMDWARQGVTHWVLDEVSMLAGEQLRGIVLAIKRANEELSHSVTYKGPPVRLTLVGDFLQLPPVKARFAFEMPEWAPFEENTTMLSKIRRQSDLDFITALQAVRRGDAQQALDFFRQFIVSNRDLEFPGTTIVAKNAQVDRHNDIKLSDLHGARGTYHKRFWGLQRPEWTKHIPDVLELKVGATVMILSNMKRDIEDGRAGAFEYVNGDIGTLTHLYTSRIVYTKTGPEEVAAVRVQLNRTAEIVDVGEVTRDYEDLDEKGRKCVVGQVSYMPIRAAYATTVHKSQGLTLDNVQVSFGEHFMSTPGMLYVALSRVRTSAGLRLVGNPDVFLRRCGVSDKVRRWL